VLRLLRPTSSPFPGYGEVPRACQPLQMRRKVRDVVAQRTPGGRFDEVALELVIGARGDVFDQQRECLGEDRVFGLQTTWELGSSGAGLGRTVAELDGLPGAFRTSLCCVEVLEALGDGLSRRRKLLRGDIAVFERSFEGFKRCLSFGTRQLLPLLLEVALKVFLRPHGEAQATFSFAALLLERAQCGLTFLSRLPRGFELLLERRELIFGLVGSD